MSKLDQLTDQIIKDPDNAWATKQGWRPIYTAHPKARIIIIGQAPGRLAQESGVPWDDPSGRNLRNWMGIDDAVFYDPQKIALVPMDFYFPGSKERGDLPPRRGFAEKWHPPLLDAMTDVKLTLLIGQYAQNHYLGSAKKKNLTTTVENYSDYMPRFLPLVHPSPRNNIWQKKNPWFAKTLLPSLKKHIRKALDQ